MMFSRLNISIGRSKISVGVTCLILLTYIFYNPHKMFPSRSHALRLNSRMLLKSRTDISESNMTTGSESGIFILNKSLEYFLTIIRELETKVNQPEVNVLIVTYMRSGSSFTADLLQKSPEVFYIFEPLFSMSRYTSIPSGLLSIFMLNETKHYDLRSTEGYEEMSRHILNAFFTCQFSKVDIFTLKQFHHQNSQSTFTFHDCTVHHGGVFGLLRCLSLIYEWCKRSRVVVAKTIRARMFSVAKMMESNRKLKVIHLLRDPRGTLRSEHMHSKFNRKDLPSYSIDFCKNVTEDLEISTALSDVYPDRVVIVRYEDICEHPLEIAEKLYRFVGLDFNRDIKQKIYNITLAGHETNCPLCTSRANSTMTSRKWRLKMPIRDVLTVDRSCSYVYRAMGYKLTHSEPGLRNINESFLIQPKIKVLR